MKFKKTYVCLLGLITAFTVFFQFHVSLPAGTINLNLADPFAVLALLTLGVSSVSSRKPPRWRSVGFNRMLLLFGALLLIGYLVGWMKIGATQWALSARIVGWIVLLGYLSAGYLLVAYAGNRGIRHLLAVLASAATFVVVWHVAIRLMYGHGFAVPDPSPNFEGFSGNRNAFAFQLLSVLALYLPYSKVYSRVPIAGDKGIFASWRYWVPIGVMVAGILWSASRAGVLAGAIMLLVAYFRKALDRKSIFWGLVFALTLWCTVWALQNSAMLIAAVVSGLILVIETVTTAVNPLLKLLGIGIESKGIVDVLTGVGGQSMPSSAGIQSGISGAESNHERIATLLYGLEMWRNSPIIGEGLGVFIANSMERFGHTTVIHSTPVWILAEFGLMGAVVLGVAFVKLAVYSLKTGHAGSGLTRSALLLLLLMFAVFSQFHEMLFQRIFWLVGGALLGAPFVLRPHPEVRARMA